MDKTENNLQNIVPMTDYTPPIVPTLDEVYKNPAPLKKLPKRWAKNAAVAAAIGIFGLSTLAGCLGRDRYPADGAFCLCNEYGVGYNGYDEFDVIIRTHSGGAATTSYFVLLTEQEIFGIIRHRLAEVGIMLCDTPPDYRTYCLGQLIGIDETWSLVVPELALDLFDARNRVGIVHLRLGVDWPPFMGTIDPETFEASFDNQSRSRITTGAIRTPRVSLGASWSKTEEERLESAATSRSQLEADLDRQITQFIARLRNLGVIK